MKNAINLVNQLLAVAERQDAEHKARKVKGKASETIGESFMVHHLKILKEELENASSSENDRP
jgi:hypothetical protein